VECKQQEENTNLHNFTVELWFDKELSVVRLNGVQSEWLTKMECRTLKMLGAARGHVIDKRVIFREMYPRRSAEPDSGFRSIQTIIRRLRQKLFPLGIVIDTYQGDGWALRLATDPVPNGARVFAPKPTQENTHDV